MQRQELAASVAVVLYIVFFSMPPPAFVSAILNNIVGMVAAFAGAAYVTLYQSKIVGGLLLLALLLTMSRGGREGFDASLGKFVKGSDSATTKDDTVYFIPSGKSERYTLAGCNPCGTENLCTNLDKTMTKEQIMALTDKGAFMCSLISTDGGTPKPDAGGPPAADRIPLAGEMLPLDSANTKVETTKGSSPVSTALPTKSDTVPIMSCNLESYSNYKRSGQTDFAAF